jgi:hypothetical protein
MGVSLFLEADNSLDFPLLFSRSDGKMIAGTLTAYPYPTDSPLNDNKLIISAAGRHLNLDLSPLTKVYDLHWEDKPSERHIEDLMEDGYTEEEAKALVAETERNNEEAWQPPDVLSTTIQTLIAALQISMRELPENLYIDEWTIYDLQDLKKWIDWAKEHGASKVRLWTY